MYKRYNNDNINYKVGIYIRLSREDGDDLESESVTNQRSLLTGFLKANNLRIINEYVDDGYSGGNFNRPGFQKLIKDIEDGIINMVLTKDLSRLGRDHIMTGYYVENYFPEKQIRYIAVNDDIDTFYETSGSDMMPFKLSMNDMYAKDISKKVRSNLLQMKKDGKFCGSVPAYGYIRDPNDKHKLIPDPKYAPIVKRIFDLYINGYGSSSIAELLTKEKVPTPIILKNKEKSLNKCNHPEIWKHSSVSNILKNPIYTGILIQHTTQNINYKVKKRKRIPKNEWCVNESAHEPLITKETFELAQSIKDKSNNYNENRRNIKYILSDYVYCKDCGAKMSISYDKKRDRITMNCNNYRKFSKYGICFSHYINYEKLEKTIFKKISNISTKYIDKKEEFEQIVKNDHIDFRKELYKKINSLRDNIENLKIKQDSLYDDKFNGIINIETYQRLYSQVENEINMYNEKIKTYIKEINSIKDKSKEVIDYSIIVQDFLSMKNPTKEILNKLIEKVYVTKDKNIEIYYRVKQ